MTTGSCRSRGCPRPRQPGIPGGCSHRSWTGSTVPERLDRSVRLVSMSPLAVTVALTIVLACTGGCTGNDVDGIATSVGPGQPVLITAPPMTADGKDVELTVRQGGVLDILTWGSGSCPHVPVEVERLNDRKVRVVMEERSNSDSDVCTTDLAPTVATVELPEDVDYRDPFFIDLEGVGPKRELGVRLGFTTGGGNSVTTPK